MQSCFVNDRLVELNLLEFTVKSLVLKKYLLFEYHITIRHLIVQAVGLYRRCII